MAKSETSVPTDIATARRVLGLESEALDALAAALDHSFVAAVEAILAASGRTILTGVGKSGHVARKIAATLASTGTPSLFVHPAEASHGDLGMISEGDVVVALSKSGETRELSDVLAYTRRFAIPLIGMTAGAASTLAQAADVKLLIPDVAEACAETNAPTTSTILMMALGDALAVALLERRGFNADRFKLFHPGGKLGAMLRTAADVMHTGEELPLVPLGAPFTDGVKRISEKGFGVVGVTDTIGHLKGIVTDGDLRRAIAAGLQPATIDEIMTRNPTTVGPNELAAAILRAFNERRRQHVFVVEEGRPVGLIHLHDLLKAGVA